MRYELILELTICSGDGRKQWCVERLSMPESKQPKPKETKHPKIQKLADLTKVASV